MGNTEIVVGIDFGTTYSGVSWAVNAGDKKIHLITDWINPGASYSNPNSDKVPTLISYNAGGTKWGFEAAALEQPSIHWFKILLEPKHKYAKIVQEVTNANSVLGKINKSPQDVAADYLQTLWTYAQEDIRRHKSSGCNDQSTKIVITVPAMWSEEAKLRTKKAAKAAGLPNEVSLVSEPEAAALAVLRNRKKGEALAKGDVFVVCDAGGGTVDLISYRIRKTDPLEIEECAPGIGGLCGSAFIDMSFEKFVKTKVGKEQFEGIRLKHRKRMLQEFDVQVKRSFAGDDKITSVELRGIEDNPAEGIIDESITIPGSLVRKMFDPVCNQVVQLVEQQINKVEEKGLNVKAVLLVGGFGASKYLHHRLEDTKKIKDNGIHVIQNNDAWSSICRGATMWGLEHSKSAKEAGIPPTVKSRIARYSYGIRMDVPFDPEKHSKHDRAPASSGWDVAKDQMVWLLKKGVRMEEGRKMDCEIVNCVGISWLQMLGTGKQSFSHTLWYCEKDPPPSRFDADTVHDLCTISHKIKKGKIFLENKGYSGAHGGRFRDVKFTLSVQLGSASLEFFVKYNNGVVGTCIAEYREGGEKCH